MRAQQNEHMMKAHQRALYLQDHMDRMLGPFDVIVPDMPQMARPNLEALGLDMSEPMRKAFEYQQQLQRQVEEAGEEVAAETVAEGSANT
jgi:hypothetical protein